MINHLRSGPHKEISLLSSFLETSIRSTYRYIELLKAIGFQVKRDRNGRLYLPTSKRYDYIPLTDDELALIRRQLQGMGTDSALAKSALQKIGQFSDAALRLQDLQDLKLAQNMELINIAMADRRQIILKDYHSVNSQRVADRLVEPVQFTDNFKVLAAYEVATGTNKYFKLERIPEVHTLETPMQHIDKHLFHRPDVFGFQGTDMSEEVELEMSMKAATMLMEEYPRSKPFLVHNAATDRYHCKLPVQDFRAPDRFVHGLWKDVVVFGSERFLSHLEKEKMFKEDNEVRPRKGKSPAKQRTPK